LTNYRTFGYYSTVRIIGWSGDKMLISRRVMLFVMAGALFTASASAGLVTQSSQIDEEVCPQTALLYTNAPSVADDIFESSLDLLVDKSLPVAPADVSQDNPIEDNQILTEGNSSFSLCLSALIGFSLLGSTHWVKKVHIGLIPEWYHDGGPLQVGHSYAISPDCLCATPVCCFIQPVHIQDNLQNQQYRYRAIVSLWRNSQFTPQVITLRGPPCMS
jgi:hypothetical protein